MSGPSESAVTRLKVVGVMGSGKIEFDVSEDAGQAIAESGHHLLTGAGGGVMLAVARAFVQSAKPRGLSLGIVRAKELPKLKQSKREWKPNTPANDYVELTINTHLPLSGENGQDFQSRNHINVLTSDVVVVLPGGSGTRSEFDLAIQYGRPTILFLGQHKLDNSTADELKKQYGSGVEVAKDKTDLIARLRDIRGA